MTGKITSDIHGICRNQAKPYNEILWWFSSFPYINTEIIT